MIMTEVRRIDAKTVNIGPDVMIITGRKSV